MSSPDTSQPINVALALAEIRRSVDVGFARIDGRMELFLQRVEQSDAQAAELKEDVAALRVEAREEIAALRAEIEELKQRRFPLPAIGALTAVAALGLAAVPLIQH